MGDVTLTPLHFSVRGALTRGIAEMGYAPSNQLLSERLGETVETIEQTLQQLHEAHALQLHPHCCKPWVVHPFALSPGSCWVKSGDRGWWANCVYCGMGIAAALGQDVEIHTRMGGEQEPIVIHVTNGKVQEEELLLHLSTPVSEWWDNVIHACASFQPFRSTADINAWCARHDLPLGAVVPLPKMWSFAADWYGDYLRTPWKKRTVAEAKELFLKHGFTDPFWRLDA